MKNSFPKIILVSLVSLGSVQSTPASAYNRARRLFSDIMQREGSIVGAGLGTVAGGIVSFHLSEKYPFKEKPWTRSIAIGTELGLGFAAGAGIGIACCAAKSVLYRTSKKIINSARTIIPSAAQQFAQKNTKTALVLAGLYTVANNVYKENSKETPAINS